jgi:hypothetical protein
VSFIKTLGTTVGLFAYEKSRTPELMFIAADTGGLFKRSRTIEIFD